MAQLGHSERGRSPAPGRIEQQRWALPSIACEPGTFPGRRCFPLFFFLFFLPFFSFFLYLFLLNKYLLIFINSYN
jgi:hypothetical protein